MLREGGESEWVVRVSDAEGGRMVSVSDAEGGRVVSVIAMLREGRVVKSVSDAEGREGGES